MNQRDNRLASPKDTGESNELTRTRSPPHRLTILDHFKQLTTSKGKQTGPKVRLEIVEQQGVKHVSPGKPVTKGRVEVVSEHGPRQSRHFLARLFETRKKADEQNEETLLDDAVINLGPKNDNASIQNRKRTAAVVKSTDEYPIRGKIEIQGNEPVAIGGFCEVYKGRLRHEAQGRKEYEVVAMKRLRVATTPEKDRKAFRRETNAWSKLKHPNILPFYGTVLHKHHIYMVSPWADNGELITYLAKNPAVDSLALLVQTADALKYLHNECKLIHGDIKGANIFVSAKGDALLADFGLITRIEKLPGVTATGKTTAHSMTLRFSAPELLNAAMDDGDSDGKVAGSVKSQASDVYAFGMLILQVYTLEHPWSGLDTQRFLAQVMGGKKPKRPQGQAVVRGLTQFLWEQVEKCLETDPADRPSIAGLLASLKGEPLPVGVADLPTKIIEQHDESRLMVVRRRVENDEKQVVLKRQSTGDQLQVQKAVQREIQALSLIQHPNILPFEGTAKPEGHLFLVTPWMENGNIATYILNNPTVDRLRLLHQASDALWYLHSGHAATIGTIVHGSLQPRNILINRSGNAMITDFGLSHLLEELQLYDTMDVPVDDTAVRFRPPEFFSSDPGPALPESDVWSFGMVMFQVLTNIVPYVDATNSFAVINNIIRRKLPQRPAGIDDSTWRLISECWSYKPEDRPSMEHIRDQLSGALKLKLEDVPSAEQVRTLLASIRLPEILDVDD